MQIMKRDLLAILILAFCGAPSPASAQQITPGVDRLYVLDCGHGTAPNQGRFSPGYNDGKPFDLSDNCYLIHHPQGYLLWGTGIADKFLRIPSGVPSYGGRPNWVVTKGLAKQLEQLDIKPSAVRYIGLANSHIDHIGNLSLFPAAKILIQKAEWKFAQNRPSEPGMLEEARLKTDHGMVKIEGDYDVFGDGTAVIIATPSVTPGNQSLLVKLPRTGAIIFSGDVIHFQYGWDHRIVPGNVWNRDKTLASFQRLADVASHNNAQLWIEHDKAQSDVRKLAPDYYE
jgi:glyoxylase-like metal-dependent hydrolase (beta-lactamase superfamily II)